MCGLADVRVTCKSVAELPIVSPKHRGACDASRLVELFGAGYKSDWVVRQMCKPVAEWELGQSKRQVQDRTHQTCGAAQKSDGFCAWNIAQRFANETNSYLDPEVAWKADDGKRASSQALKGALANEESSLS
ncbi:hypothetical protein C8F01DRAFT_1087264 [Mycena amicta]|nr:hypothetical protein C8F01DRAFT_1087264 [Mycena amicta]